MDLYKDFSSTIKGLRYLRGYSLQDVSRHVGVSANYISELERGLKKNPSDEVIDSLASFYNIKADRLYKLLGIIPASIRKEYHQSHKLRNLMELLEDILKLEDDEREKLYGEMFDVAILKLYKEKQGLRYDE